jgi:translation initiation factor 2 subunit 3
MVLDMLGIKNVVIVQNKIDLVKQEKALENYKQIKAFLKGTTCANAPIIPISANYNANIDALIEAIETAIPTPKRDLSAAPKLYVARSFDINKPGTDISKVRGGVIGGSLICGTVKKGDKLMVKPGITKKSKDKEVTAPLTFEVTSVMTMEGPLDEAKPGGLVGIGTRLDPALTKGDTLVGNMVGTEKALGPVLDTLEIEYTLIKRDGFDNPAFRPNEPLVVSVGTATSIGMIVKLKGGVVTLKLKRGVYAEKGAHAALSRRVGQRWRLCAFGKLK